MIIPIIIFATTSFFAITNIFSSHSWAKSTVSFILIFSILISFTRYLDTYWDSYRSQNSSSWQYGYQQVMEYVGEHQTEYDRIFITKYHGEPHIFYAFFTKLDPYRLQPNKDNIRFAQSDWFWTDKIDNIFFVNDWQIPAWQKADTLTLESGGILSTKNSLIIASIEHLPSNTEILQLIEDLDGNTTFIVAKFK